MMNGRSTSNAVLQGCIDVMKQLPPEANMVSVYTSTIDAILTVKTPREALIEYARANDLRYETAQEPMDEIDGGRWEWTRVFDGGLQIQACEYATGGGELDAV